MKWLRIAFTITLMFTSNAFASTPEANAKDDIIQLHDHLQNKTSTMQGRLKIACQHWLHRPYQWFTLGEGPQGQYDQAPRFRTDIFDCETYVDTVLAVSLTNNFTDFKQCIDKIRYQQGKVSFITRNHFTSIDWNHNNQKQGILEDITLSIIDQSNQSVAKIAKTPIDKKNWYKHMSIHRIRLASANTKIQEQHLLKLRQEGEQFSITVAKTPYIPLDVLFNSHGEPSLSIFNQIPDGAIVEIVRPKWDLTQTIGTHLDISHLGFVFREHNELYFYQASNITHQVTSSRLIEYLQEARKSPTIRGINLQIVVPKEPIC